MAKTARRTAPATEVGRRAGSSTATDVRVAQFGEHAAAIALLTNVFHVRHLVRLYAAFDGDLLEALVLGEVAHHNFSPMVAKANDAHEFGALARSYRESGVPPQLPTNAYSISAATGIPRETVRRKIEALIRKGFLRRDEKGSLFTTPNPREYFSAFSAESVTLILDICRQIHALLGEECGPERPKPRRRPGPSGNPEP